MITTKGNKFAVYADAAGMGMVVDLHKEMKNKSVVIEGDRIQVTATSELNAVSSQLDWKDWLPYCAKEYNISDKVEDYILLPTIICPSDFPNRNGVGFPLEELIKWDPEIHQQAFRGWKGCPSYEEHKNDDCKQARGVVIDSVLRKVKGFKGNIFKVLGLAAFDRNKYPDLAHRLLTRQQTDVSMGAMVEGYRCSLCNALAGGCGHINLRRPRDFYIDNATGRLVYRKCVGIQPFELSSVATPAWTVSSSAMTIDLSTGNAYKG